MVLTLSFSETETGKNQQLLRSKPLQMGGRSKKIFWPMGLLDTQGGFLFPNIHRKPK